MPSPRARIVGSNFTTFNYQGKPIAFLQQFSDGGQRALPSPTTGSAYEFITPLGAFHPVEIANGFVLQGGLLSLQVIELWDGDVWQQLDGLGSAENITDVWALLARNPAYVTCQSIISPPGGGRVRGKTYHNCKVVDIDDTEAVQIGSLSVAKVITVAYTHTTKI